MIILGIDAGFTAPGFAMVKIPSNLDLSKSQILKVKCLVTERSPDRDGVSDDDARRIRDIATVIDDLVKEYDPGLATIELPSGGAMSAGAIKGMGMATAMTVACLHILKVPHVLFSPMTNKRETTGDPYAIKEEMIAGVHRIWFDIPWPLKIVRRKQTEVPDERQQEAVADALATVIAYSRLTRAGKTPKMFIHPSQVGG